MTDTAYHVPSRMANKRFLGREFGKLTVTESLGLKGNLEYWGCLCVCGATVEVATGHLTVGRGMSCGCSVRVAFKVRASMRDIWYAMIYRCGNTNSKSYKHYGGKGIKVCERWLDFENFKADMGDNEGLSLDRIDSSLGYCKENCRWTTMLNQTRNRSNTIFLTYEGTTKTLAEWAEATGIAYGTLRARKITLGYSDKDCLTKPVGGGLQC